MNQELNTVHLQGPILKIEDRQAGQAFIKVLWIQTGFNGTRPSVVPVEDWQSLVIANRLEEGMTVTVKAWVSGNVSQDQTRAFAKNTLMQVLSASKPYPVEPQQPQQPQQPQGNPQAYQQYPQAPQGYQQPAGYQQPPVQQGPLPQTPHQQAMPLYQTQPNADPQGR